MIKHIENLSDKHIIKYMEDLSDNIFKTIHSAVSSEKLKMMAPL